MKKILVTGGLGFIGSNLIPELKKRGHVDRRKVYDWIIENRENIERDAEF